MLVRASLVLVLLMLAAVQRGDVNAADVYLGPVVCRQGVALLHYVPSLL